MTPTVLTPDATLKDRFLNNAEAQLRSGSTWVLIVGGIILTAIAQWSGLADAIDKIPGLHGMGAPIALIVATLVAKFKPSNAMTSATQKMVAELFLHRLNAYLRSQGSAEIPMTSDGQVNLPPQPAPTPAPAPAPAVVVVAAPPEPPAAPEQPAAPTQAPAAPIVAAATDAGTPGLVEAIMLARSMGSNAPTSEITAAWTTLLASRR